MGRSLSHLLAGALLSILTVALLVLVRNVETLSGVTQVAMIISGMTAMSALVAMQRFIDADRRHPLIHHAFNETFLSRSIAEGLPKSEPSKPEKQEGRATTLPAWDFTADQLVGFDNALALACLRMDIERELRPIAYEARIDISTRPAGVINLARELVRKEVVPVTFLEAIQKIMNICNMGIHGDEVPDNMTAAVIRVGMQLLERLRWLPEQHKEYLE